MGETGCGKTRLIRYMCDLARQDKDVTNMLIMKVKVYAGILSVISPPLFCRYMVVGRKLIL